MYLGGKVGGWRGRTDLVVGDVDFLDHGCGG